MPVMLAPTPVCRNGKYSRPFVVRFSLFILNLVLLTSNSWEILPDNYSTTFFRLRNSWCTLRPQSNLITLKIQSDVDHFAFLRAQKNNFSRRWRRFTQMAVAGVWDLPYSRVGRSSQIPSVCVCYVSACSPSKLDRSP